MTEVTYGRLDRALRSLGFSCRLLTSEPKTRLYEHESGAMIMLPALPLERKAFPHHVDAVRGTLHNYGIASPVDFANELEKVG
jgi:hypothetical protein